MQTDQKIIAGRSRGVARRRLRLQTAETLSDLRPHFVLVVAESVVVVVTGGGTVVCWVVVVVLWVVSGVEHAVSEPKAATRAEIITLFMRTGSSGLWVRLRAMFNSTARRVPWGEALRNNFRLSRVTA